MHHYPIPTVPPFQQNTTPVLRTPMFQSLSLFSPTVFLWPVFLIFQTWLFHISPTVSGINRSRELLWSMQLLNSLTWASTGILENHCHCFVEKPTVSSTIQVWRCLSSGKTSTSYRFVRSLAGWELWFWSLLSRSLVSTGRNKIICLHSALLCCYFLSLIPSI